MTAKKKQEVQPIVDDRAYEIERLKHVIGVQNLQYKDDLKNLERVLDKYRKENASLKAYIKALVNRNIFQRIRNTQPPFNVDL